MRSTRLVGVICAVLLIVGSEAWAECAWVLWQETVINKASRTEIRSTRDWNMQSAHPSYSECVRAARQLALDGQSNIAVTMTFGAPGKLGKTGEQGIYRLDFSPWARTNRKRNASPSNGRGNSPRAMTTRCVYPIP